MTEELRPIRLKYEDGEEYILEFNAQTVKEAEGAGFRISEVSDMPMTMVPLFFFYAFKMHHPTIKRKTTDKILSELGGRLTEEFQERLVELYIAPINSIGGTEDTKNPKLTVEL